MAGKEVGLDAVESLEFVLDAPEASAIIWEVGDSNIVLRTRRLAIQAARSALEAAGFALPEPNYRLRSDAAPPPPLTTAPPADPRAHLTRYHGVFAPASPDRSRVVPGTHAAAAHDANDCGEPSAGARQRSLTWAQRLKRVFAIDIETCRRCGGRLRVIASIEDPEVIERILEHLSRDAESVDPAHSRPATRRRRQSRAPPEVDRLI